MRNFRTPVDKCAEIPYKRAMQTVIETPAYLASAKDEGLTDDEREAIVLHLAANPDAGDVMAGTGGARKLRFAGRGKGKSGGYRIITFYADADIPVFLLDVFSKGTQANLSKAERNALRDILTALPQIWRAQAQLRAKPGVQDEQSRITNFAGRARGPSLRLR
jgi:hypothetical protein